MEQVVWVYTLITARLWKLPWAAKLGSSLVDNFFLLEIPAEGERLIKKDKGALGGLLDPLWEEGVGNPWKEGSTSPPGTQRKVKAFLGLP